jgi:dipeptidyl aminopeptidase/acylaminoacyl peptidase
MPRLSGVLIAVALLAAIAGCNTNAERAFDDPGETATLPADADILFVSNLYQARAGAPRELYAVSDDGSNLTRLTLCNDTSRPCDNLDAAVAPDRTRAAVRRIGIDADGDGRLTAADGIALIVLSLTGGDIAGLLAQPSNQVSGADWSSTGDVLVYTALGQGGVDDFFRIDPNGQNSRNLTQTETIIERHPRIDPTGSVALFERIPSSPGLAQIYLFTTSVAQVPVTTGGPPGPALSGTPYTIGSDADPDYSPDGRSFVFRRLTSAGPDGLGTWDILTAAADGTGVRAVASGPIFRGAPDWGATGIVFPEGEGGTMRLVVIQPDGSGRRTPVTTTGGLDISSPRWLP